MLTGLDRFRPLLPVLPPPSSAIPKPAEPSHGTLSRSIFPGNVDTMPYYDQGTSNGCGTTSEAMIASYLLGRSVQPHDIDHQIRRFDVFTSPEDMVRYAQRQGLSAEMYNGGAMNELQGFIGRGIPCQALISADGSGSVATLHYVAVVGFGKDTSGNDCVVIHDPARGAGGREQFMPVAEFEAKWSTTPGGFSDFFIAYAPGSTALPAGRRDGIEGSLATVEGLSNTVNGLNRIVAPTTAGEYLHGFVQLPVGVGQTIAAGAFGAVELAASWTHRKTDGIPVIKNIVGPATDTIGAAAAAGADVINGLSQGADDVGQAAEDVVDGHLKSAGKDLEQAAGAVVAGGVQAVADVGKGVGHAIKSLFSW